MGSPTTAGHTEQSSRVAEIVNGVRDGRAPDLAVPLVAAHSARRTLVSAQSDLGAGASARRWQGWRIPVRTRDPDLDACTV